MTTCREHIKTATVAVIKVGSKVLLQADGRLDYPRIAHLAQQVASLHKKGRKVIFVTSGAIGAGMEALSLKQRPTDLPTLQAAAAIGQVRLMRAYEDLFAAFDCSVAQVLLTHDDLKDRARHLNIKRTITALLNHRIIPIINENDTVATDEIKFGDNDVLASLVAMLLEAKALILLTTAPGFIIDRGGKKEILPHLVELTPKVLEHIEAHKVGLSVGGMKSKLEAAANMIHVGGLAVIAPGQADHVITELFDGENIGTVVGDIDPKTAHLMPGRKRWIAFYHRAQGSVVVDEGAKCALIAKGKSLLPVGIKSIVGDFSRGSVVEICDDAGRCFAKGIAVQGSLQIRQILEQVHEDVTAGKKTRQFAQFIHRDDLVILKGEK